MAKAWKVGETCWVNGSTGHIEEVDHSMALVRLLTNPENCHWYGLGDLEVPTEPRRGMIKLTMRELGDIICGTRRVEFPGKEAGHVPKDLRVVSMRTEDPHNTMTLGSEEGPELWLGLSSSEFPLTQQGAHFCLIHTNVQEVERVKVFICPECHKPGLPSIHVFDLPDGTAQPGICTACANARQGLRR